MHWLNVEAFLPKNLYASVRSNSCLKKLVQLAGTYYRACIYVEALPTKGGTNADEESL